MFAETFATDSYQNVLLSLIQYPLFVRHHLEAYASRLPLSKDTPLWPQKLIIISHQFKESRFRELHLPTIRAPIRDIDFVGIDPPFVKEKLAQIIEGDKLRGYGVWKDDPYGTGGVLREKRVSRGWDETAFVDKVLRKDGLWSEGAQNALIALVKGEHGAKWPA